jgi:hypothetical protein
MYGNGTMRNCWNCSKKGKGGIKDKDRGVNLIKTFCKHFCKITLSTTYNILTNKKKKTEGGRQEWYIYRRSTQMDRIRILEDSDFIRKIKHSFFMSFLNRFLKTSDVKGSLNDCVLFWKKVFDNMAAQTLISISIICPVEDLLMNLQHQLYII